MAGVLANTTMDPGFANAATPYVANLIFGDSDIEDVDWAVGQGTFVNSQSWNFTAEGTSDLFSGRDQYLDWRTRNNRMLFVTSAGKDTSYVAHKGYNLLVVGGAWSDGTIANGAAPSVDSTNCSGAMYTSNWVNDSLGQELPHLTGPGGCTSAVGITDYGVSIAPAAVAGMAAGLTEYDSDLDGWPEALKAILMASPNGYGGSTPDGCTWGSSGTGCLTPDGRDGTGLVHGTNALNMASNHQPPDSFSDIARYGYDFGFVDKSDFGASVPHLMSGTHYVEASAGCPSFEHLRVVLVWDSTVGCSAGNSSSCSDDLDMDLDLRIYEEPGGSLVSYTSSTVNSYEQMEEVLLRGSSVNCVPSGTAWYYRIEIALSNYSSVGSESTYYGLAWHTY